MAQVTLEQASKVNEGGGKYFKLKQDESKQVRFLWDKWEEVNERWCFTVHEIQKVNSDGSKYFKTVDCPRVEANSQVECKYCSGEVCKPDGKLYGKVSRVIIPLYNIDDDKIQYWKRSYDWFIKTLKPVLEEVTTPSLAGQTFKIKRAGSGLDTSYTPIAVPNATDNRTKADFGAVEYPYDLGIVKRYEEDTEPSQAQGQVQAQPSTDYQPRRTTEVF